MELRVKEVCKDKGVTLAEIASKIGVAQASLSKMLGGNPTIGTLEKISTALNVPVWQLFASPEEVTGEGDLTVLIHHKGYFYKATTIAELEKIVDEIKEK